jgi:hypothetical protein
MTEQRRLRQRHEIIAIARSGQLSRATALVRDHMVEFPDDGDLAAMVLTCVAACDDPLLAAEAQDLFTSPPTGAARAR